MGRAWSLLRAGTALPIAVTTLGRATVLAAGTDGTDGPTAAAGAVADGQSRARAEAARLDIDSALAANDAFTFFHTLGDLVSPGPTGTNLLDLYLLVRD